MWAPRDSPSSWRCGPRTSTTGTVRLKDVRGEGDRVVAFAHQRGVGKVSGAPVDMDFAMAFTLRDGQVTDVRAFLDDNEALTAAGLG